MWGGARSAPWLLGHRGVSPPLPPTYRPRSETHLSSHRRSSHTAHTSCPCASSPPGPGGVGHRRRVGGEAHRTPRAPGPLGSCSRLLQGPRAPLMGRVLAPRHPRVCPPGSSQGTSILARWRELSQQKAQAPGRGQGPHPQEGSSAARSPDPCRVLTMRWVPGPHMTTSSSSSCLATSRTLWPKGVIWSPLLV